MGSRRKTPRNFRAYGTMEGVNVLLIPALGLYLGWPRQIGEAVALLAAILPTAGFLIVGAAYWWGLDRKLAGDRRLHERWLVLADRAERPLLVLLGLAAVASVVALQFHGWSRSVIVALAMTLLAMLEYVNYYQRQLQHFDNWADFKRLLTSRRLPRAHSARELAEFRRAGR